MFLCFWLAAIHLASIFTGFAKWRQAPDPMPGEERMLNERVNYRLKTETFGHVDRYDNTIKLVIFSKKLLPIP